MVVCACGWVGVRWFKKGCLEKWLVIWENGDGETSLCNIPVLEQKPGEMDLVFEASWSSVRTEYRTRVPPGSVVVGYGRGVLYSSITPFYFNFLILFYFGSPVGGFLVSASPSILASYDTYRYCYNTSAQVRMSAVANARVVLQSRRRAQYIARPEEEGGETRSLPG